MQSGPSMDGAAAYDAAMPYDAGNGAGNDLSMTPPPDLAMSSGGSDGTPMRQSCTGNFGSALSSTHARLDGYLRTVLSPGQGSGSCNGDSSHVHLQVSMNGGIYDVAVDIGKSGDEVAIYQTDLALPDGAWSEGWHTSDGLSYTSSPLNVTSSQFTQMSPSNAATTIENALMQANHVSIFGTGYGPTGMHLIHYQNGSDGAIVIDPLSPTAHIILIRFQADSF